MKCATCNYPIPSWQHQGACKPVAEKVPVIRSAVVASVLRTAIDARDYPSLARVWDNSADDAYAANLQRETPIELNRGNSGVTENPPALPKRRGRPKKDDSLSPAQKQAAYRARKRTP